MKLVDVKYNHEGNVTFGTCEMCFSVGSVDNPTFIFEDEDGMFEVDGYRWDYIYGDYFEVEVSNVVEFAAFVASQSNLKRPAQDESDYVWLRHLHNDYVHYLFDQHVIMSLY